MPKVIAFIFVLGLLVAGGVRAGTVTVHKTDDSTLTGNLISANGGQLLISPAATQPSTQPSTKPSTRPAGPSTRPVAIAFDDIVQVVLREPPPKSVRPIAPKTEAPQRPESGGFFSGIAAIFGGGDDDAPPVQQPRRPQPKKTAPATMPATKPLAHAGPGDWRIKLTAGDLMHGQIVDWSDQKISLRLGAPLKGTVVLTTDRIAELWWGTAALEEQARSLHLAPGPEDVALVEKEGKVVAVHGLVLGLERDSLRFRYDEADRKIALARLVGIIMGASNQAAGAAPLMQRVQLDSGDALSGVWTGMNAEALSLRLPSGTTLQIPRDNIYTIDWINGCLVYVSDLKPAKVEQTAFFGRVIPFRLDCSLEGGPIQLADGTYAKGIAVHSRCVLQYALDANFERFRTKLGFERPEGLAGRVAVRVLGDAKVLYENPDLRGDAPPIALDLDVTAARLLTLEVDFGKDQDVGAHVVWANARLLRAKTP